MLCLGSLLISQSMQYLNSKVLNSKFDLPIVIEFWELIVTEDNVLNIFFFAIALLLHNR